MAHLPVLRSRRVACSLLWLRTPRVFAVAWAVSHHCQTVLFDLLRRGPDSGARRRRVADTICVNDQKQPAAQAPDASASDKCKRLVVLHFLSECESAVCDRRRGVIADAAAAAEEVSHVAAAATGT